MTNPYVDISDENLIAAIQTLNEEINIFDTKAQEIDPRKLNSIVSSDNAVIINNIKVKIQDIKSVLETKGLDVKPDQDRFSAAVEMLTVKNNLATLYQEISKIHSDIITNIEARSNNKPSEWESKTSGKLVRIVENYRDRLSQFENNKKMVLKQFQDAGCVDTYEIVDAIGKKTVAVIDACNGMIKRKKDRYIIELSRFHEIKLNLAYTVTVPDAKSDYHQFVTMVNNYKTFCAGVGVKFEEPFISFAQMQDDLIKKYIDAWQRYRLGIYRPDNVTTAENFSELLVRRVNDVEELIHVGKNLMASMPEKSLKALRRRLTQYWNELHRHAKRKLSTADYDNVLKGLNRNGLPINTGWQNNIKQIDALIADAHRDHKRKYRRNSWQSLALYTLGLLGLTEISYAIVVNGGLSYLANLPVTNLLFAYLSQMAAMALTLSFPASVAATLAGFLAGYVGLLVIKSSARFLFLLSKRVLRVMSRKAEKVSLLRSVLALSFLGAIVFVYSGGLISLAALVTDHYLLAQVVNTAAFLVNTYTNYAIVAMLTAGTTLATLLAAGVVRMGHAIGVRAAFVTLSMVGSFAAAYTLATYYGFKSLATFATANVGNTLVVSVAASLASLSPLAALATATTVIFATTLMASMLLLAASRLLLKGAKGVSLVIDELLNTHINATLLFALMAVCSASVTLGGGLTYLAALEPANIMLAYLAQRAQYVSQFSTVAATGLVAAAMTATLGLVYVAAKSAEFVVSRLAKSSYATGAEHSGQNMHRNRSFSSHKAMYASGLGDLTDTERNQLKRTSSVGAKSKSHPRFFMPQGQRCGKLTPYTDPAGVRAAQRARYNRRVRL